jgi:simple sugar transport system ATP-binding protein
MTAPILSATGIGKRFGPVVALREAGIAFHAGRVTAIVGENGAGKSTLAKILAGVYRPDEGTILIGDRPHASLRRPEAIAAGIGFVPQSLSFVGTLSIVDNHLLSGTGLMLDRKAARDTLLAAMADLDVSVPLDRSVETLSLAERQLGEIVSAVAGGARILFLDEPTSTLGPAEIDRLIAAVRLLAGRGTAIGLVTHRVREVLDGADDVTVLRAGEVVFQDNCAGLDGEAIARLMVGERSRAQPVLPTPNRSIARLVVDGLSIREKGACLLDAVTFTVGQGEILGVAGVAGPSQPALAEALAGLCNPQGGFILVDHRNITGNPAAAQRAGLAYIPEDRGLGLIPGRSVAENASLLRLDELSGAFGLRRPGEETKVAQSIVDRFDVRPPRPSLAADRLSGGNQQKLLVGRELDRNPAVVIAHGPTQGLDLAAASAIRAALVATAEAGAAVVVISADLDELLSLSHALIVIAAQKVADRFDLLAGEGDIERIGRAMTGTRVAEAA